MSNRGRERKALKDRRWGGKAPPEPIYVCRSHVPLPSNEVSTFGEDANQIATALGHLDEQMARLEKRRPTSVARPSSGARACTDPKFFRSQAKTILASKRCLQAGMWRANARRRFSSRVSVHAILTGSYKFDVLKKLNEKVTVRHIQKADGTGHRKLWDFGPVARGAQDLTTSILRMTYTPRDFQFDDLGAGAKVQSAMDLVAEGFVWFAEVDIIDFFPSFERSALEEALSVLPKEAVAQIVVAYSAMLVTPKGSSIPSLSPKARPGIPLGSSASVEVAKWCVATMPAFELGNVVLINHVDNFYLFARDFKSLEAATKTLRSAIQGCPGGHFEGKLKQEGSVSDGFNMLGCDLLVEDGHVVAEPTDANLKKLRKKFGDLRGQVAEAFALAEHTGQKLERFLAVVDFAQMENFAKAWASAFSICADGFCWNMITEEHRVMINVLKETHALQEEEMRIARRYLSAVNLDRYWF